MGNRKITELESFENGFVRGFEKLGEEEAVEVKEELMRRCGWTENQFYSRRRASTKLTVMETIEVYNLLVGEYGVDKNNVWGLSADSKS